MIIGEAEVTTVGKEFYSPMARALEKAAGKRECPEFTDEHFLKAGVGRCLNDVRSGRDWIQRAIAIFELAVTVSRFFISLRSERRLGTDPGAGAPKRGGVVNVNVCPTICKKKGNKGTGYNKIQEKVDKPSS